MTTQRYGSGWSGYQAPSEPRHIGQCLRMSQDHFIHKGKKYIDLGSGLNFSENAPRWVPSILTGCVKQIPHLDPELGVLIHSKNREERGKKHIFFTRHVNDAYKEHLKRWLRIPVLQDSYKTGLLF